VKVPERMCSPLDIHPPRRGGPEDGTAENRQQRGQQRQTSLPHEENVNGQGRSEALVGPNWTTTRRSNAAMTVNAEKVIVSLKVLTTFLTAPCGASPLRNSSRTR
jgi:hypothetical protein